MNQVQVIAVEGLPLIKRGDDLAKLICEAARKQHTPIQDGDTLVVTHVAVSKAEGNVVNLDKVKPRKKARDVAEITGKEPELVEVILQESNEIVRMRKGVLITESKQGFVSANSGVDRSNIEGIRNVAPLPKDPDLSASKIRAGIKELTGRNVAVIVSDTHGRPFRMGEVNVAVGLSGLKPIRDRRGEKDLFGYVLRIKQTAIADELASAAELVIGQADEGIPVAIIRGYHYPRSETAKARELARPKEKDMFRQS
jgi:coenzyme F420-0:L-glutamate ligase/coenzyme F420-1:gamma-L-glutamate ligase